MQGFVASGPQAWRHRQRMDTKRPAGNDGQTECRLTDGRGHHKTREGLPELRMLTSGFPRTKGGR